LGAHTKTDPKVHLVWIPKCRKAVLTGEVALRVRDLSLQALNGSVPRFVILWILPLSG
jgi:REP element-mobilizing transposase RayT